MAPSSSLPILFGVVVLALGAIWYDAHNASASAEQQSSARATSAETALR
jgi:hypothetical protein